MFQVWSGVDVLWFMARGPPAVEDAVFVVSDALGADCTQRIFPNVRAEPHSFLGDI